MASPGHVIETTSLTNHYGSIVAVDGLSMSVPRGHVFGLLGPNGSGKTTTMSMLLGLVRPTSGGFNLFGSSDGLEAALHRVGAIIESPSFYPYLTGRQNLLYFQGISGRGSSDEIDGLLERVGLEGRGDHKFRTYSLGMKQRLGLAYALLGDPELLFLDEPTNGMDPAGMAEVRDLIRSLGTGGPSSCRATSSTRSSRCATAWRSCPRASSSPRATLPTCSGHKTRSHSRRLTITRLSRYSPPWIGSKTSRSRMERLSWQPPATARPNSLQPSDDPKSTSRTSRPARSPSKATSSRSPATMGSNTISDC